MSARTSTMAVTIASSLLFCTGVLAQKPGATAPPTGAAARDLPATPPPPLFFGEQWKLGKKVDGSVETDQVGVTQQNVSAASVELDLVGPSDASPPGSPITLSSGSMTTAAMPLLSIVRQRSTYCPAGWPSSVMVQCATA